MVSDVFNILMYADDTTLYCNTDQNVSEEVINNELSKVSQWLTPSLSTLKVLYPCYYLSSFHFYSNGVVPL